MAWPPSLSVTRVSRPGSCDFVTASSPCGRPRQFRLPRWQNQHTRSVSSAPPRAKLVAHLPGQKGVSMVDGRTRDIPLAEARLLIQRAIDKAEQLRLRGGIAVYGGSG